METHTNWQNGTASKLAQMTALKYLPLSIAEDLIIGYFLHELFFRSKLQWKN